MVGTAFRGCPFFRLCDNDGDDDDDNEDDDGGDDDDDGWPCASFSGKQHFNFTNCTNFCNIDNHRYFGGKWNFIQTKMKNVQQKIIWDKNVLFWIIFGKSEQILVFLKSVGSGVIYRNNIFGQGTFCWKRTKISIFF